MKHKSLPIYVFYKSVLIFFSSFCKKKTDLQYNIGSVLVLDLYWPKILTNIPILDLIEPMNMVQLCLPVLLHCTRDLLGMHKAITWDGFRNRGSHFK